MPQLVKLKLQQSTEEVDKVKGDEQGITKLLDKVLGFILKNGHNISTSPVFLTTVGFFFVKLRGKPSKVQGVAASNLGGSEVEMPDLPW